MGKFEDDILDSQNFKRSWLDQYYRLAFPSLRHFEFIEDKRLQKAGIDLNLHCGKGLRGQLVVKVDEKVRFEHYGDILIEEYSNWEEHKLGWGLDTSKVTDWLAYIIVPAKEVYFIYFPSMQKRFIAELEKLLEKSKNIFGGDGRMMGETKDSEGQVIYRTSNIPVSIADIPDIFHYGPGKTD